MKRKARKASESPATHNGVYRADEISKAFGIPKSVVYLWTVQEKLVRPDYKGTTGRPALYLEKSAAAIFMINEMLKAGIKKADVKKFLVNNRAVIMSNHPELKDFGVVGNGSVRSIVRIGWIRQTARELLKENINGMLKELPTQASPVQPHNNQSLAGTEGVASL